VIFNVYNSAIPSSTHDPHNMVAASEHTKSRGRLRAVPVYRKRSYAARPVFRGSPVPSGRHSSLDLRPGTSTRRHPSSDVVNPLLGEGATWLVNQQSRRLLVTNSESCAGSVTRTSALLGMVSTGLSSLSCMTPWRRPSCAKSGSRSGGARGSSN